MECATVYAFVYICVHNIGHLVCLSGCPQSSLNPLNVYKLKGAQPYSNLVSEYSLEDH